MAFLQANIYSNVLEMEVSLNVILPQKTEKRLVQQPKEILLTSQ